MNDSSHTKRSNHDLTNTARLNSTGAKRSGPPSLVLRRSRSTKYVIPINTDTAPNKMRVTKNTFMKAFSAGMPIVVSQIGIPCLMVLAEVTVWTSAAARTAVLFRRARSRPSSERERIAPSNRDEMRIVAKLAIALYGLDLRFVSARAFPVVSSR